ncbi:unnamed protein product, partial [Allacma fusca]
MTPILSEFPSCVISLFQLSKSVIAITSTEIKNPFRITAQGKPLFTEEPEGAHFTAPKLVYNACLVIVVVFTKGFSHLYLFITQSMIIDNTIAFIATQSISTGYNDVRYANMNSVPNFLLKFGKSKGISNNLENSPSSDYIIEKWSFLCVVCATRPDQKWYTYESSK